jgi:hypothetical protein
MGLFSPLAIDLPGAIIVHNKNVVMTNVAIVPEMSMEGDMMYRAVAGARQSLAKSAGAALDAIAAQLPPDEGGTLVIVQNHGPDHFFNAQQQLRLAQLMERWRAARDSGAPFPSSEEEELNALVEAEAAAAGERAKEALAALGK